MKYNTGLIDNSRSPYRKRQSAALGSVKWCDGFWNSRFDQCRNVTLPHLWDRLSDPNLGHAMTNLRIYAGLEEGEFQGTPWQDEWVYKWLEAGSYVHGYTGDADLDQQMEEIITVIQSAQEEDGYIASQILRFKERFLRPQNHELYVMGHLLSAACAHYRSTGRESLLGVARKCADYLHNTFMPPRNPQYAHFGINPSYIMGSVELYRTTGENKYLDLALNFIEMRSSEPGGTDLNQTHVPLKKEEHVVGHSVFWTYLYAGATDAYMECGDTALLEAVERLWQDLVTSKLYVHGGVCALHHAVSIRKDPVHEAAGASYELPNSTAYNETCSQIGNLMWNWRMLMVNGEARHADLMELNMYNSIISGISLSGDSWFYTNPLRWYGKDHPLLSQDAYERFQPGEPPRRHHICCPSNLLRTIAGLHGYFYSLSEKGIHIDHYGASIFDGELENGSRLKLSQETEYPWHGRIRIVLDDVPEEPFAISLRIPAWAFGAALTVNGQNESPPSANAYATLERHWRVGDLIELDLPMNVRLLEANPRVEACRNHVAVMRGPLVYCLESPDLPENVPVCDIRIPRDIQLKQHFDPELLGGITVLEGEANAMESRTWGQSLYRELNSCNSVVLPIRLIPYYAWSNRGISEMTVWIPLG